MSGSNITALASLLGLALVTACGESTSTDLAQWTGAIGDTERDWAICSPGEPVEIPCDDLLVPAELEPIFGGVVEGPGDHKGSGCQRSVGGTGVLSTALCRPI